MRAAYPTHHCIYRQVNAITKPMTSAPTDPATRREEPLTGGAEPSGGEDGWLGGRGTSSVGASVGVSVGVSTGELGTSAVVSGGGLAVGVSGGVSGGLSTGGGGGAVVSGGGGGGGRAVGVGFGLMICPSDDWLMGMYEVVG